MKNIFFIYFFIFLFSLSFFQSTSVSPGTLEFNLQEDQEICKRITFNSQSDTISISDRWAENENINWSVNLFDRDSEYHSISISYPHELTSEDNQVEVCLSGEEAGEYKGVVILTEEQQGNSIVQIGVWLKVFVLQRQDEEPTTTKSPSGSSSSPSSSSSGGSVVEEEQNETPEVIQLNTDISYTGNKESEEESESSEGESSSMTGGIVGAKDSKKDWSKLLFVLGVVILLTIIFTYNKRRKNIE